MGSKSLKRNCTRHGELPFPASFHLFKSGIVCKQCKKEQREKYYEENKERIYEGFKNSKKYIDYQKKYKKKNKKALAEYQAKYQKVYQKENKEQLLEHQRAYREKNREKIREYHRLYAKKRRKELLK